MAAISFRSWPWGSVLVLVGGWSQCGFLRLPVQVSASSGCVGLHRIDTALTNWRHSTYVETLICSPTDILVLDIALLVMRQRSILNLYIGFSLRACLYRNILPCRWCVVFGGGLIACYGSHLVHYDGAGSLAAIILAFVAMVQWRRWQHLLIYPSSFTLKIIQLNEGRVGRTTIRWATPLGKCGSSLSRFSLLSSALKFRWFKSSLD